MPKKDRTSQVHEEIVIQLMLVKENLDRPDENITIEDISESLIEDRMLEFQKNVLADDFQAWLEANYEQ